MKVNPKLAAALHVALIAMQVLNWASAVVPSKYQWLVAGLLAITQGVLGMLQHFSPVPQGGK